MNFLFVAQIKIFLFVVCISEDAHYRGVRIKWSASNEIKFSG